MSITTATTVLLNAATTVSSGSALAASGLLGEIHNVSLKVTSSSDWTAIVAIQTESTSGGTWTSVKTWSISGGVNGFSDSFSLTLASGQSVRGSIISITGTSTSVTLTDVVNTVTSTGNITFIPPGGQSAIPVVLAPNGTIATNGIVTLGTALPAIYANAWVYFPANAVVGGAAGLYFTQFTSTTAGQVTTSYVSAASAFTPTIPSTVVNAVGSNAAYTQTTASALTLANVTIPAGAVGANGQIYIIPIWTHNSSVGAKVDAITLSSTSVYSLSNTTNTIESHPVVIQNRGVLNSQLSTSANGLSSGATTAIYSTVDLSVNQSLKFTGNIATATDYIVLEGFSVEITPS